jgi:hypothetical protein
LNPRYDLHNNNGGHVKNVKNVEKSIKITKMQSLYGCLILLLSGDVSINTGPTKFPCGVCSKAVRKNQRGILCEDCIQWFHIKCIDLPVSEYNKLPTSLDSWYCNPCTLPNFTDSFFDLDLSEESNTPNHDYVPSSSEETSGVNKNNCTRFKELRDARKLHPRNFITAYLNVNSIRYKLDEIRELLTD